MQISRHATWVSWGATVLAFVLLVSGCASTGPVPINPNACAPEPCRATTITYSTTYFQARYMGKSIGKQFGLIGALISEGLIDYDTKHTAERQNENEFEKRLGAFDTSEYFFQNFEQRLSDSRRIALEINKDPNALVPIAAFVRSEKPSQTGQPAIPDIGTNDSVAAFRVAYGLAMRFGDEQFGFRKYYRPFIRLNGIVKDVRNGQVLWQDSVVAFGDNRYLGDAAEPQNINPAELIAAFKTLTPAVIDLIMRSINGEILPPMPELVGTNPSSDIAF